MARQRNLFVLALSFILVVAGSAAPQRLLPALKNKEHALQVFAPRAHARLHPAIKNKERAIQSVIILPPSVQLVKSGIKGGEGMLKESAQLGPEIGTLVASALKEKGIAVLDSPFGEENLKENNDAKYALADIQSRYDALMSTAARKPKDIEKGRFSMGDQITNLNTRTPVDAFVFVRATGQELTGGKKAFGWLVAGPARSSIIVSIGFIDSKTGDLLCATGTAALGEFIDNPEKVLAKGITKSLKKLPGTAKK